MQIAAYNKSKRSGLSGSFGVPAETGEKRLPFDVAELDGFALERWEVRRNPAEKTGSTIFGN